MKSIWDRIHDAYERLADSLIGDPSPSESWLNQGAPPEIDDAAAPPSDAELDGFQRDLDTESGRSQFDGGRPDIELPPYDSPAYPSGGTDELPSPTDSGSQFDDF